MITPVFNQSELEDELILSGSGSMLQQRGVVRRKQNRAMRAVSLVLASAMGEYLHRVMRLLRINFETQKHLRELERLIEQASWNTRQDAAMQWL